MSQHYYCRICDENAFHEHDESTCLAALRAERDKLQSAVTTLTAALEYECVGAPETEPERYEGSNSGDSEAWASNLSHYCTAKRLRAALEAIA